MIPNWERIQAAYDLILRGDAKKMELEDGTLVYSCGKIIRVDIKVPVP